MDNMEQKHAPIACDPSSQTNIRFLVASHTIVNLTIDFSSRTLHGNVIHKFVPAADCKADKHQQQPDYLILDTSYLDISYVRVGGQEATWELLPRVEPLGSALRIQLGQGVCAEGSEVVVEIGTRTTEKSTALQFLSPDQTSTKKHPFMFSQCQPIHARSIFPCQDTPAIKATYDINLVSAFPTVSSGIPDATQELDSGYTRYRFVENHPIPSYLFAVASGEIVSAPVGVASRVYTSPDMLEACTQELEEEVDKFITEINRIIFPYVWGQFNILVLPPSFPYGGMENPVFTFVTPSIISGDKQNVDVIAHELSHSWSGNLVTNATWGHFWLNEGWTTYLERRILGALHGEAYRHFAALIGWEQLERNVQRIGSDHEYTKLVVNLGSTEDPDDALSTIPYEKGFALLFHLEQLLGREPFDQFARSYFMEFKGKSLTSEDFKRHLLNFLAGNEEVSRHLQEVDWGMWLHGTGLPPYPEFDTSLVDVVHDLAQKWTSLRESDSSFVPRAEDIKGFFGNQLVVFLDRIMYLNRQDNGRFLTLDISRLMGAVYGFRDSNNLEITSRYLDMSLQVGDREVIRPAQVLLGSVGRMKYVRKLYKALAGLDFEAAKETLHENRNFYHPICKNLVEKDLKLVQK